MSTTNVTQSEFQYREDGDIVPQNIGHLLQESTDVQCPACQQQMMTRVALEPVTCFQNVIAAINFCLCCTPIRWNGRYDINHYCSKCGCFIGRYITLSWYKRTLFRIQRNDAEQSNKWQRFKKVQKEELDKKKEEKLRVEVFEQQKTT